MLSSLFRQRGLALVGAATIAAAASTGATAGKLVIGHTTWVGYGTLYLARDLGYFKESGLDVDLPVIEEAALYMAAQASSKIDGSASTVDELMKYRSPNFCFKAVLALDESFGGDGILVRDGVKKLEDLKGMQVALNEGSTSQFWFSYLLKRRGLPLNSVEVKNMTADDAATAFIAKRVPVAVTWEPHLSEVKKRKDNSRVLIDSTATPGVIADVVALNCDVIKNRPQDVRALVKGVYKAVAFTKANPQKAYAIMAKGVGGYLSDPKDFAESAKGVRFYDPQMNERFIGTPGKPGSARELIGLGNEIWGLLGKRKMEVSYADMVEPGFVTP